MISGHLVGHDSGRVGIDQDHLDAFFAEGAGSLSAGIVKFARLTNNNRAAADNQNRAYTSVSGHC